MSEFDETQLAAADAEAEQESASSPATLARGSALGRYLILDELGAGGMGVVYSAYDPELDRKVALKLLRLDKDASNVTDGRTRILREAQAIARLSHPNVVAVYDVGTYQGQVFIAMELVDGATLGQWLREEERELSEIREVFLQAGRGLAAAHAAGLVHRDFKPDNVIVGSDGRARVLDFGVVREVEGLETAPLADAELPELSSSGTRLLGTPITRAGVLIGTPNFMAPEQFLRKPVDARTDQFSFCVVLYMALYGRRPFVGGDLQEVAHRVVRGGPPELPPGRRAPAHLRALLRRGLSREPAARYPSMDALLKELGRDPAAGRRRWLAVGAALAAVAAVAGGMSLLQHRRRARCGGGGERLAAVWDPMRRRSVEQTFAATRRPYAAAAFAGVARTLNRYADAWVRSYEDSCAATRVRGEQSEELLDLRSACLAERRSELASLVDVLAHADARMVERAGQAASSLSPIADCDDLTALRTPVRPPSSAEARRSVAAIRDELARVHALQHAARLKEALPLAAALLARAQSLRYRPLEAEVGLALSQLQDRTGASKMARGTIIEALAAAEAGRHDELRVRLASAAILVSSRQNDFERAHEWARMAAAGIERLGEDERRRSHLHHTLGYLYSSEGKIARAAEEYERAREIRERSAAGSLELARTLTSLANVYDELGRYAEARAAGERALAIERAELGPSHPDVATVFNNLGNIASDEGDLKLALDYYRRALAIREQALAAGEDQSLLADVLNNLGIVEFQQGRDEEALAYHRRALRIREEADPKGADVAMSLDNIGAVLLRQRRVVEAQAEFQRALGILEAKLGRDHPFVSDALTGIGQCARAQGRLEQSQAVLERALKIRRAGARPNEIAEAEFALARTLWDRDRRDTAVELARSARKALAGSPANRRDLEEIDGWLGGRGRSE